MPDSATPDSPEVAVLKERRVGLTDKLERLKKMPKSKDHDLAAAQKRTENGIKELDTEIQRLTSAPKK